MANNNVVSSAFSGMRYLIFQVLQIASRIITFILNTQVIVAISTDLFGIFSVQYQLIMSTILFITREGFRRACQRSNLGASGSGSKPNPEELAKVMNLAWLSVPLGVPVTLGVIYFFKRMTSEEELAFPNYEQGIYLFAIGSFLEIVSEPVYILAQNLFLMKVRTVVEASAIFARCIITYFFVVIYKHGLLGFGYAQILYGSFLIVGYYGYFFYDVLSSRSSVSSFSQVFPSKGGIDRQLAKLWSIYEWQSVEKLILTEGEKVVLWLSASLVDQGIYSVVNNLGSLVARFLFQPVEEMCYALFSKLLANSKKSQDLETGATVLRVLTKFMILTGCIFIAFGPNYSSFLLNLLFGNKFSDTKASSVLAWYCVYVAVIAVNGITEAFVHAVATPQELRWFNILLISFSLIYVSLASLFIRVLETSGLIFANCIIIFYYFILLLFIVNMGLRVAFSANFIRKFFQNYKTQTEFKLASVLPNKYEAGMLLLSFIITRISNHFHPLIHVALGAFFGLATLSSVYFTDRAFCAELKGMFAQRRAKKE